MCQLSVQTYFAGLPHFQMISPLLTPKERLIERIQLLSTDQLHSDVAQSHSPIQPATPMPRATTSATLLAPSSFGAAPVALALALAPVLLATPDKLPVEPLGLAAVVVDSADVEIGLGWVGKVITGPLRVGVEVSEVGMVNPETVVRGMDTSAWAPWREARRMRGMG